MKYLPTVNRGLLFLLFFVMVLVVLGFYYSESRYRNPDSPILSSQQNVSDAYIPDNWQTYKNEQFNYSLSHPKEFQVTQSSANGIMIAKSSKVPDNGPVNFVYVSVIPSNYPEGESGKIYNYRAPIIQQLEQMSIGESKIVTDNKTQAEWYAYFREQDTKISGFTAKKFINTKPWEFPSGVREIRYILTQGDNLYLIGGYLDAKGSPYFISEDQFNKIIGTVKLP